MSSPASSVASTSRDDSRSQMLGIVVGLLCVAILLHKARLGDRDPLSHHTFVCLTALWTLVRPSSVRRFATLVVVYLASTLVDMPDVVNHILFFAVSMLPFGLWMLYTGMRQRAVPSSSDVYTVLAPYVRLQAVLMYAFAALAKLNEGFFHPELSCGVHMYRALVIDNFLPQGAWTAAPAIWGTVLVELALPILLSLRATRLVGVFVAIGFHITMALAEHVPFSGFALPLLAVFLPDDVPERLSRARERHRWLDRAFSTARSVARHPVAFPLLAVGWVAAMQIPTYEFLPRKLREAVLAEGLVVIYVGYTAALAGVLWLALRQPPASRPLGSFRLAHPILVLGPVLTLLNAAQPYVGLKTHHSFTMYSNLQTEAGQWNHLVLPSALRVFPLQDDVVTIIESDDRELARSAARGSAWVVFAFNSYLARHPNVSVTYERGGRTATIRSAADRAAQLGDPPNPILDKLFSFRVVDPPGEAACRW